MAFHDVEYRRKLHGSAGMTDLEAMRGAAAAPGAAAIGKALAVLDEIGRADHPLSLAELARINAMPKPSLHRILATLEAFGMAGRDAHGGYVIGLRLIDLAHRAWRRIDIRAAAIPELDRLRDATHETTRLALLVGLEVVFVEQRDSPHPIALRYGVGDRAVLPSSGAGKAILAFLPPDRQAQALALVRARAGAAAPNQRELRRELRRDLAQVRTRGYAVDDEGTVSGIRSIGAPILGPDGLPVGSLTIVAPAYRCPVERLHRAAEPLMQAAQRISGIAIQR
jgi:DNA-binding IclR family transcriptional regulator